MVLVVVALAVTAGVMWLVLSRPRHSRHANPPGHPPEPRIPEAPKGPDDDPDFLRDLDRRNTGE